MAIHLEPIVTLRDEVIVWAIRRGGEFQEWGDDYEACGLITRNGRSAQVGPYAGSGMTLSERRELQAMLRSQGIESVYWERPRGYQEINL